MRWHLNLGKESGENPCLGLGYGRLGSHSLPTQSSSSPPPHPQN